MRLHNNNKGKRKGRLIIFIAFLGIIAFLINFFMPRDPYDIERYLSESERETLISNIVTYMEEQPHGTDWQTLSESQKSQFYATQRKNFTIYKYFIAEDSSHYFYIIRPENHPMGNYRAIGGRYKVDEHLNLSGYEVLFVTQVLELSYLRKIAPDLFKALINNNMDKHIDNRLIIEWPDEPQKYNKIR